MWGKAWPRFVFLREDLKWCGTIRPALFKIILLSVGAVMQV